MSEEVPVEKQVENNQVETTPDNVVSIEVAKQQKPKKHYDMNAEMGHVEVLK